jgi:Plasmid pRiA4b ORF-3-like protein
MALAALRLRKGARFTYEYDLNIPWRHEVRIENQFGLEASKTYPVCTGGGGACPPEDCDGPAGFMAGRNGVLSLDGLEDLDTLTEIIGQVVLKRRTDLLDDENTRWRLEKAVERSKAREGSVRNLGRYAASWIAWWPNRPSSTAALT